MEKTMKDYTLNKKYSECVSMLAHNRRKEYKWCKDAFTRILSRQKRHKDLEENESKALNRSYQSKNKTPLECFLDSDFELPC